MSPRPLRARCLLPHHPHPNPCPCPKRPSPSLDARTGSPRTALGASPAPGALRLRCVPKAGRAVKHNVQSAKMPSCHRTPSVTHPSTATGRRACFAHIFTMGRHSSQRVRRRPRTVPAAPTRRVLLGAGSVTCPPGAVVAPARSRANLHHTSLDLRGGHGTPPRPLGSVSCTDGGACFIFLLLISFYLMLSLYLLFSYKIYLLLERTKLRKEDIF